MDMQGSFGLFVMPFGKYKGKTLEEISLSRDGLLYLDWAAGALDSSDIRGIVSCFLQDPSIQDELDRLLEDA